MLNNKQKSYLKSLANKEKAVFQIGKDGLSDNMIQGISNGLKANELLKFTVLKTCPVDIREIAFDLAAATNSEVVQIIGRTAVLYRHNPEGKIHLPK